MKAKSKRAVIFLNGNLSEPAAVKPYINSKTMLIACDGGLRHLQALRLKPDVIIGDFDSVGHLPEGPGITQVRYPADKDATDSELAVRYAMEAGCGEVILTGFLGDRVDHMLANTFLLSNPDFAGIDLKVIDGGQEIYAVRDQAIIRGHVGDTISFLPVSGKSTVKSSGGLKYDLNDYVLSPAGNQGISNVLTREQVEVNITQGMVLVVHNKR